MSEIKPWDERRNIVIPGDKETTIQFCTDHFIKVANDSISDHGAFYVALSGGSTPKAIFNLLSSEKYSSKIDWSKVYLFWSDERSVSPEDEDSNYNMAMRSGFNKLPIPKDHIFRMEAEKDLEASAKSYEETIKKVLKGTSFDLVMLGMGDDGHTASLFPGTKGLEEQSRLVIPNFIPEKDTWRMTFTFSCINNAKNIAIYVLGSSKTTRLQKVLSEKGEDISYPSGHVGTKSHKALWVIDLDASELIA